MTRTATSNFTHPGLCAIVLALIVTSVIASSFDDDEWEASFVDDDVLLEKRESALKQCQRCLAFRNTKHKAHCNICKGIVAGYKRKRSSLPNPDEVDEANVEEDASDLMSAYSCCRQLGIGECCQRSERLVVKRGYETSYFPMEEYGNGQCSCCDAAGPYEFSCCNLNCSKRK